MLNKDKSAQKKTRRKFHRFKKTNKYPKSLYIIYNGDYPIYVGITQQPIKLRFRQKYRSDFINNNRDILKIVKVGDITSPTDLLKETLLIQFIISIGYELHNKTITPGAGVGGAEFKWDKNIPRKINGLSERESSLNRSRKNGYKNMRKFWDERDRDLASKCRELVSKGHTQTKIGELLGIRQDKVCRLLKKYL